jgi:iron(III) transport system ATP-binding protein
MNTILEAQNLFKTYEPAEGPVVSGVDLALEEGDILALLGPSGCGKTTTLRCLAGFEHPEQGKVVLAGETLSDANTWVRAEKRDIGFVFQDYALFPHLTVEQNIAFGLKKLRRKERKERVARAIATAGLNGLEKRSPHELSGGQQQRVALARSIAPNPKIILMDEPFSNLDAALRSRARAEIRSILKRTGMSAILVTHDQEEALTVADQIAVMNEGKIEQMGSPIDIYRNPDTSFVASFLGATNILSANAQGMCAHTSFACLDINTESQGDVLLSVRPEQLTMVPVQNGQPSGKITRREFKGHDQLYRVQMEQEEITVLTDHLADFQEGEQVSIRTSEPAVVLPMTVAD